MNTSHSQFRLIRTIFSKKKRNLSELSRKVNLNPQHITNWKARGKVPLKHAGAVAKILKINTYLLNYDEITGFLGKGKPWKDLVQGLDLTKQEKTYVLAGKFPKADDDHTKTK